MTKLPTLPRRADHIVRRIYEAAVARNEAERRGPPRLRMSRLGECQRLLWAELQGIPSERDFSPRMLLIFEHGRVLEDHVVRLLRLAGYEVESEDPEKGGQFELEGLHGALTGHLDGKIQLKTHSLVLEVKSANTEQFAKCQELGYEVWNPKYADQLCLYMGYSGLHEALACVYCKDTSELYFEKIRFDRSRFAALIEKANRILAAETPVERPAEATSQYCGFCKWCTRNEWCWGPLSEAKFDD